MNKLSGVSCDFIGGVLGSACDGSFVPKVTRGCSEGSRGSDNWMPEFKVDGGPECRSISIGGRKVTLDVITEGAGCSLLDREKSKQSIKQRARGQDGRDCGARSYSMDLREFMVSDRKQRSVKRKKKVVFPEKKKMDNWKKQWEQFVQTSEAYVGADKQQVLKQKRAALLDLKKEIKVEQLKLGRKIAIEQRFLNGVQERKKDCTKSYEETCGKLESLSSSSSIEGDLNDCSEEIEKLKKQAGILELRRLSINKQVGRCEESLEKLKLRNIEIAQFNKDVKQKMKTSKKVISRLNRWSCAFICSSCC